MQRGSYCYRHYKHVDPIIGAGESLGPQLNIGAFVRDVGDYNNLLLPPFTDQHLSYNKDILRDIMLKHEAIFKYQIYELHHLYKSQRELMGELQMQKIPTNGLVSPLQSDVYQTASLHIPYGILSNSTDVGPHTQGLEIFPKASTIVSGSSIQMGSDLCTARNDFKEFETSASRENKFRKRLPDLELPATLFMDSDEREKKAIKLHSVLLESSRDNSDSSNKISTVSGDGTSTKMNLSCQKFNCVFDLNEPVQVDETENPTSSIFLNMSHKEIMHQDHNPCGSYRFKSSVLSEIAHNIPEQKGRRGTSFTSGLQDSFFEPLPCNVRAGLCSETARNEEDLVDFNRHAVFTSSMTNSSSLDPLSIDINTLAFERTSTTATVSTGIQREYLIPNLNDETSPSLGSATFHVNYSTENQSTNECHSISSNFRNLDCTKSGMDLNLNVMPSSSFPETETSREKIKITNGVANLDLNVVPYSHLSESEVFQEKAESIVCSSSHDSSLVQPNEISDKPDCDCKMVVHPISLESLNSSSPLSALASITSPSSSSENEDIQNWEQKKLPAGVIACISSHESEKCGKDDIYISSQSGKESSQGETCTLLPFAFEGEVPQIPAVAIGVGIDNRDLHGPDEKPSPPREDLEENQSKLKESNEGLDRIAAETIISISSSRKQQVHMNGISRPSEASVNRLDWFAGIVSSASGSLENEFEDTLSDAPLGGCNEHIRNSLIHCEAKIFKSIRTMVGETFSKISNPKNKIVSVLALPCQQGQRRISPKNAGEQKKNQARTAPDNIRVAKKNATEIVRGRRKFNKTSLARGKQMSSKSFPRVAGKRKCNISKQQQQTDEIEQGFTQSWLFAWGKKHRRQKHRRATKWGNVS